jgi:hypothetical protein
MRWGTRCWRRRPPRLAERVSGPKKALLRLKNHTGDEADRAKLLKETAGFVYAWFIQRELCGFRRHDAVIRDLQIPREVLVRLGAA